MIGLVVDSNSQLPAELAERYAIEVVPLTVSIDGTEYLEGVDLDADDFYAAWEGDHTPEISTSQPAPGEFVAAYARLAGTASFGISCCAWAAAEVVCAGGSIDMAFEVASERAASLRTSFVVGLPQLIDRSGRVGDVGVEAAAVGGIPVLAMSGPDLSVLTTVSDPDAAVAAMVDDALAWPPSDERGLRVAIGSSDASSRPMSLALTDALRDHRLVAELVQYRIGPSVGAHTGPGTSGLFVF